MSIIKIVLVGGAVVEFLGIIFIASPDLVPYGLRFSRWLRNLTRPLFNHISRLLGRPRGVTMKVLAAEEVNLAERISLMKSAASQSTLEEKVQLLLTRDQEAQRDINAPGRGSRTSRANHRGGLPSPGARAKQASSRN